MPRIVNGYEIISGAYLSGAYLSGANLSGSNLSGANLSGADLSGANLRGSNLRYANLWSTNLSGANLSGANLSGADLRDANISGADLRGVQGLAFQIPQEGPLTVYKKLRGGVLAKLRVPSKAKRTATPVGRKCRAEYVKVLSLSSGDEVGMSIQSSETMYRVGEYVYPDKYDADWRDECTHGIHFFLTEQEAIDY